MDLGAMAMKRYSIFPQSSSITGASPSDGLESHAGHLLGLGVLLQRSNRCILLPMQTGVCVCVCVCFHNYFILFIIPILNIP